MIGRPAHPHSAFVPARAEDAAAAQRTRPRGGAQPPGRGGAAGLRAGPAPDPRQPGTRARGQTFPPAAFSPARGPGPTPVGGVPGAASDHTPPAGEAFVRGGAPGRAPAAPALRGSRLGGTPDREPADPATPELLRAYGQTFLVIPTHRHAYIHACTHTRGDSGSGLVSCAPMTFEHEADLLWRQSPHLRTDQGGGVCIQGGLKGPLETRVVLQD